MTHEATEHQGEGGANDPALSVLGNIKQRQAELVQSLFTDIPVPRWTAPELFVRYQPLEHPKFRQAQQRVDKAKPADKGKVELESNMDLLIQACIGVYAELPDEDTKHRGPYGDGKLSMRLGDPDSDWTRFDRDLAAQVVQGYDPEDENSPEPTARQVVRGVYLTGGDVLKACAKLAKFSGYAWERADDELGES